MPNTEPQAIQDRIQAILDAAVVAGVPGISAAISNSRGSVWRFQAGHKDVQARTPLDADSAFGVGSITKVFVAVVVLQLVEEGDRLSLDDTVDSILDRGIWDHIGNAGSVRIRDLLSHTGAIASWEDDPDWIRAGRGEDLEPDKIWKKHETLQYVKSSSSAGLMAGKYHYANTNYTLLGLIIERVTNETAESEIRTRILEPLGLKHTYLEGFEEATAETPRRYHWATEQFRKSAGLSPAFTLVRPDLLDVTDTNLSVEWTGGGMISTPSDLLRFASALRKDTLLNPESLAVLTDWHSANADMDVGHGVFRLRAARAPGTWIGHNGGVLGFSGALWWDLEGTRAVSILSNVGTMHAGHFDLPSSAAHIVLRTEVLALARELAVH